MRGWFFVWCISFHVKVAVALKTPVVDNFIERALRFVPFIDDRALRATSRNRRDRIYANSSKLERSFGSAPMTRQDLFATNKNSVRDSKFTIWISSPYRVSVLTAAYVAYPFLIAALRQCLPDESGTVSAVSSSFAPAVSLLYGSWLGLTFNILEERIGLLQRTATSEAALLGALTARTSLSLGCALTSSTQTAQTALLETSVREVFETLFEMTSILAIRSREDELLGIANDDVTVRYRAEVRAAAARALIADAEAAELQNICDRLAQTRAERLSKEAKSLPAAHFAILSIFSLQFLACFVYTAAQSPSADADPVLRVAFAFFAGVLLLVFNFALDLNDPFRGNYQIRRSAINANLVSTRKLIALAVGDAQAAEWTDKEQRERALLSEHEEFF